MNFFVDVILVEEVLRESPPTHFGRQLLRLVEAVISPSSLYDSFPIVRLEKGKKCHGLMMQTKKVCTTQVSIPDCYVAASFPCIDLPLSLL